MRAHPAAELFPMMTEAELRQLADDIKAHGLADPITMLDGMILDGRNRFEACKRAGVEPRYEHPQDIESPTVYVVSRNLHRRHLTVSQRAAIGAEMMPLLRAEAKQRQIDAGVHGSEGGRGNIKTLVPKSAQGLDGESGRSREIAGRAVGVGHTAIQIAAKIKRDDPEEFERVRTGAVKLEEAHRNIRKSSAPPPSARTVASRDRFVVKDANRRRMEDGLSMVRGACRGLSTLNVTGIKDVCSAEDLATWASVANECAKQLRDFARKLSNGQNSEVKAG